MSAVAVASTEAEGRKETVMSGQIGRYPGRSLLAATGPVLGAALLAGAWLLARSLQGDAQPPAPPPGAQPTAKPDAAPGKLETAATLRPRLAYEARHAREQPKLSKEVVADLENLEHALYREYRAAGRKLLTFDWANPGGPPPARPVDKNLLSDLHDKSVQEFVRAEGFGMERMVVFVPKYLELPEAPPIALASTSEALSEADIGGDVRLPPQDQAATVNLLRMPSLFSLKAFHLDAQQSFLNLTGFAFVARDQKDRKAALKATFKPHQFRHVPEVPAGAGLTDRRTVKKERWQVRRIELVSLLKHDEPVAYVTRHLPRMDELRKAPTRPLEGFEEEALKALRQGETLATDATVNRIQMLGAVRATKQCLTCHQVERGALLGAFSYELWRSPLIEVGAKGN
jgi:hypothetical protein